MTTEDIDLSQFHPYKRGDVWYVYWWEDGRKVPKSLKTKAKRLVNQKILELAQELNQAKKKAAEALNVRIPTVREFSQVFFIPGQCSWMSRQAAHGQPINEGTAKGYRTALERYIWPDWGNVPVDQPEPEQIEDWAISLVNSVDESLLSMSYRSRIMELFWIVLDEAARAKWRDRLPAVKSFRPQPGKRGTLTDEELFALFPADPDALSSIWRSKFSREPEYAGLLFGTMFQTMVSTGMRTGEARALEPQHVFLDGSGVAIVQAINAQGQVARLKKGTEADPRFRVVLVPERTIETLRNWLPKSTGRFVFEFEGTIIQRRYVHERLVIGLERLEIDWKSRNITPHSLRYTYRTRIETLVDNKAILDMMGHRSAAMGALYSRPHMLDRIKKLGEFRSEVDRFWE